MLVGKMGNADWTTENTFVEGISAGQMLLTKKSFLKISMQPENLIH